MRAALYARVSTHDRQTIDLQVEEIAGPLDVLGEDHEPRAGQGLREGRLDPGVLERPADHLGLDVVRGSGHRHEQAAEEEGVHGAVARRQLRRMEIPALIKAVDEGFQSSETEQSLSVEEVRELIRQCATRSK